MNYNPHTTRVAELTDTISSANKKLGDLQDKLRWFDQFRADDTSSSIATLSREVTSTIGRLSGLEEKISQQDSKIRSLRDEASLGFDPRYWFSSQRAEKKLSLDCAQQEHTQLKKQERSLHATVQQLRVELEEKQNLLKRFRAFDPLEAQATIAALGIQVRASEDELADARRFEAQVDQQLKEPLEALRDQEKRKRDLQSRIAKAEFYQRSLNNAANGYERKMIHEKCANELGEAKPSRVINKMQREIESVTRNIGKLDDRLKKIGQRSMRVIGKVVIDGNNLCYEQGTFIGLCALLPVSQRLSSAYSVTIIFDSSIRALLQMRDKDIAAKFGKMITVHVVATKTKADETILDASTAPTTYVVSNDRFKEFPDKSAVRDQRLIRHEIVNNTIFIHDLEIAERFSVIRSSADSECL